MLLSIFRILKIIWLCFNFRCYNVMYMPAWNIKIFRITIPKANYPMYTSALPVDIKIMLFILWVMYFQWLAWKGSKRYVGHGGHLRASLWCFSRWLSVTDNLELFPWNWNHRSEIILFVCPHVFPFMREEYKGREETC